MGEEEEKEEADSSFGLKIEVEKRVKSGSERANYVRVLVKATSSQKTRY